MGLLGSTERVTPHKLSVCILIYIYTTPLPTDPPAWNDLSDSTISALAKFIHSEITRTDQSLERLKDEFLSTLGDSIPHLESDTVVRAVNGTLESACASPDNLLDLIERLKELLGQTQGTEEETMRPTGIVATSRMGVFLRRVVLSLSVNLFSAVSRLYDQLVAYVDGAAWASDGNAEDREGTGADPTLSPQQLQQYLSERANELELQSGLAEHDSIEEEIRSMLRQEPDLPRAFWLRFLNSLAHNHEARALDSLHRYFDFAVRKGGPATTREEFKVQQKTAQSAILLTAAVHWHFGQFAACASAIDEAVKLAQENGNKHTIALALGWLHRLMLVQGHPKADFVLNRCARVAFDSIQGYDQIQTTTLLSLAQARARSSARSSSSFAPPSDLTSSAFGPSRQAMALPSAQAKDEFVTSSIWTMIDAAAESASNARYSQSHQLYAERQLLQASVCQALGQDRLALLIHKSFLLTHTLSAKAMDFAAAQSTFCTLSSKHRGRDALTLLDRSKKKIPNPSLPFSRPWVEASVLELHRSALRRGLLLQARNYLMILESLYLSPSGFQPNQFDKSMVVALAKAQQLMAEGQGAKAVKLLKQTQVEARQRSRPTYTARLLLEEARCKLQANPGEPSRVVMLLSQVLAVSGGKDMKLSSIHAEANGLLGEVFRRMGATERALGLLRGVLPKLRQVASTNNVAHAYLEIAKCQLAISQFDEREPALLQAIQTLNTASKYLDQCPDANKSQVVEDPKRRNLASQTRDKLSTELSTIQRT